ncbi:sulfatase-like hydrolase/transferase [Nocardioides sp. HDW12B]|uniref:sulfatase-like hydrolase/transferase n=1 Tax=Nocardioides sp. HDW12B TaxID=2714939 RepID=UPI00140CA24B|nr:sulfatase-like hydrolase/transferase [Nocardioides sp. HDW12B]QIK66493.1 sulfatase-like hydrolase/transferase [Nocardioides sp. HDW12B]
MKLLALLTGLLALALAVLAPTPTVAAPAERDAESGRANPSAPAPNVVLITVDDMRADDVYVMTRTRELVGQLDLTDFISNHPLCCPARAQLLTGQFGQNNGVHHNNGGVSWAGYKALEAKNNTFARWFRDGGYATAMVGKFLNGYTPASQPRPGGWDRFTPLVGESYSAYNYSYLQGTTEVPAPAKLHTNDFVTRETEAWVDAAEARDDQPFLIWSSYVAPHTMSNAAGGFRLPLPAGRHRGDLDGVVPTSEQKPSYEGPGGAERARAMYQDARVAPTSRERARAAAPTVRELNQARLESLLSVDEGVERIIDTLRRRGELDRTIVVFTSDNGHMLGEHGQMGKNTYYEEALRVPFLARGPGVGTGDSAKGSMIVDIAPSLAALAGVRVTRAVDGRSDLFDTTGGWTDQTGTLIQAGSLKRPWMWRGTRTSQWTYVRTRSLGPLLYDRAEDPFQLKNLAGRGLPAEQRLADRTPGLNQD